MNAYLLLLTVLLVAKSVNGSGLEFLVMGDWGGQPDSPYYTTDEKDTAATMGQVADNHDISFVLGLGDNFYDSGIPTNVKDPRFKETFEDVFTQDSLLKIPFYMVAGNHDHLGNLTAEIEYTNISPNYRWQYPDYWYSKTFSIPNSTYTLQIIMIDTVIMCGDTVDSYEYCTKNDLKIESPECSMSPLGPSDEKSAEEAWEYINKTLSSSTADFIIMAGHYPIWSVAEHGPTDLLVAKLRPILIEYNVQLYMNGHDHTMEYIQETNYPNLGYVTTGAAHDCDTSTDHNNDIPKDSLLYHDCNDGGFVRVEVNNDGMKVIYYLSNSASSTYTTKTFGPRSKSH